MPPPRPSPGHPAPLGACALGLALLAACAPAATTGGRAAAARRLAAADSAARAAIANERAIDAAALPPRTVSVAPFAADARDTVATALAYGLADLLITDLSRSRQLTVVERQRTDAMLRELRLAETGRVDSATAPRVGRLLGARRIVVGTIGGGALGEFAVAARIADASTGTVVAGGSTGAALERVLDAEKAIAFQLFDALQINLSPAERAAVEQRPTRSIAALLAHGRAVREEAFGRYDAAAALYRDALRADPAFAAPRQRLEAIGGEAAAVHAGQGSALSRVAALGVDAVNAPAPTRVSEAVDASSRAAQDALTTIILTIRVP